MDIAERVKARREALGMSQEDLALKMGYKSRSSVNKIENGRPVTQKIVYRLSQALGVSVAHLMGWDKEPTESIKKDNDVLADLIVRMRIDDDFLSVVKAIDKLDKEKLTSLSAFLK